MTKNQKQILYYFLLFKKYCIFFNKIAHLHRNLVAVFRKPTLDDFVNLTSGKKNIDLFT